MFALPPAETYSDDLQPLSDAIDVLCKVLDIDRETVIEGLAEIVRKRAQFENTKICFKYRGVHE
jgi:hypothetical protein